MASAQLLIPFSRQNYFLQKENETLKRTLRSRRGAAMLTSPSPSPKMLVSNVKSFMCTAYLFYKRVSIENVYFNEDVCVTTHMYVTQRHPSYPHNICTFIRCNDLSFPMLVKDPNTGRKAVIHSITSKNPPG